ncbi:MAG: hypothetical protein AAFW83_10355 [Pseudomonadota bacterium]
MNFDKATVSHDVNGIELLYTKDGSVFGIQALGADDLRHVLCTKLWASALIEMVCGAANYLRQSGQPGIITLMID